MPMITANGLRMYYEQHGSGEDLVLIAGLSADHTTWKNVIEPLSKQYRVTVFDNRGAGQTDVTPAPYSIEQMAEDTAALLNALNIQNAYIAGHSMGGMILQVLLAKYPELTKKAMLICSSLTPAPLREIHRSINKRLIQQGVPMPLILENVAIFLCSGRYLSIPGNLEAYVQESLESAGSPVGFSGQDQAIAAFDRARYLSLIRTPLLGLFASEDLCVPPADNIHMLKQHAPHAEIKLISQCGHLPQREKPAELIDAILTFAN